LIRRHRLRIIFHDERTLFQITCDLLDARQLADTRRSDRDAAGSRPAANAKTEDRISDRRRRVRRSGR
jgi:hypothetical protein